MNRLIRFFIDRSFVVNLLSFGICLVGLILLFDLKKDLIPRYEIAMVTISATLPGASPINIEKEVIYPIEESLMGMPAIKRTSSVATSHNASLSVYLKRSVKDREKVLEEIRSRLQSLKSTLPQNIEYLEANLVQQDQIEFQAYAVKDANILKTEDRLWIKGLEESLRKIPGIVQIEKSLPQQHLFLDLKPEKLSFYGISPDEIRSAVMDYFQLVTLGYLEQGSDRIIVDFKKPVDKLDEIAQIPIKTLLSGNVLTLNQIAKISIRTDKIKTLELWEGRPFVALSVIKDLDSDALALKKAVKEKIAAYQKNQPHPRITIDEIFDGSELIEQQLEVLKSNGLFGFLLVLLFLTLFVGFRIALMTAFSLPIAYLGTVIVLYWLGIAIDLISVIGMILVVGMLVDDAIIVSENYSQNLEGGMKPREAALKAAQSLIAPVTGTVITTMVAFSPILLISSEVSDIFKAIPIVIISALALSWLECFFVLPNHLQHFVKTPARHSQFLFHYTQRYYVTSLKWVLKLRYLAFIALIGIGFGTFKILQNELYTRFDLRFGSKSIEVIAMLKQSSSLEESRAKLRTVEAELNTLKDEFPISINTLIGRAHFDGKLHQGERFAQIIIYDKRSYFDQQERPEEIEVRVEEIIERMQGPDFEKLTAMVSRFRDANIKEDTTTVFVKGDDRLDFKEIADAVQKHVKNIKGYKDIFLNQDSLIENWQFQADPKALSKYGISMGELGSQINSLFAPVKIGQTRINGEAHDIYTELQRREPLSISELSDLKIFNRQKIQIPISYLGSWIKTETMEQIYHRDGQRVYEIDLKYDRDQTDLNSFMVSVERSLEPLRQQFPSFSISVEAGDEAEAEAKNWISNSISVSVVLILLVLALTLNSIFQSLLVGIAIPFGMIGVIWALYFHGNDLELMAMIGLLGVAGVAVNDALVMVYAINQVQKKTKQRFTRREAILEGAGSRLRAILLTTITTLGGVFPMAYGWGGDSGFTTPLAFSMGWGVLAATFATIYVIPIILEVLWDANRVGAYCWHRLTDRLKSKRSVSRSKGIEPESNFEPSAVPRQLD